MIDSPPSTEVKASVEVPALSPRLRTRLQALPLLRLRLRLRLLAPLTCDPFLGNLIRGQLGAALHTKAPKSYQTLMGDAIGARRWTLEAPWEATSPLAEGHSLDCYVTLIGNGVNHASELTDAFASIARHGLGRPNETGHRTPVRFEGAELTRWPEIADIASNGTISALSIFDGSTGSASHGMQLKLRRPLCIKQDGQALMTLPSAEQLLRRAIGRLVQLLPYEETGVGMHGSLFQPDEHAAWMFIAQRSSVRATDVREHHWLRHSHRTHADMPLKGLTGCLVMSAPGGALLPWFRLAEWLHLGSKTTFGFGAVTANLVT